MTRLTAIVAITLTALSAQPAQSQQSKLPTAQPPQGVVSNAQPWITHQEWFCIPRGNYNANQFATSMAQKISGLAQTGWEPLAFNQVAIAGESCFLATFKAPKQK